MLEKLVELKKIEVTHKPYNSNSNKTLDFIVPVATSNFFKFLLHSANKEVKQRREMTKKET